VIELWCKGDQPGARFQSPIAASLNLRETFRPRAALETAGVFYNAGIERAPNSNRQPTLTTSKFPSVCKQQRYPSELQSVCPEARKQAAQKILPQGKWSWKFGVCNIWHYGGTYDVFGRTQEKPTNPF